jgi:hypothetical protein
VFGVGAVFGMVFVGVLGAAVVSEGRSGAKPTK